MAIIIFGGKENKEFYGNNETVINQLKILAKHKKECEKPLELLNKSIENFNSLGVEIDLGIRYNTSIYHENKNK